MATFLLASSLVALAAAQVVPTGPAPNDTFTEGQDCTIQWDVDTTGTWTNMDVQLMTGSNDAMVPLALILGNYDGTTGEGKYTYTCPTVEPNAYIYFYQFSNGGDISTNTWTGRWGIADASGNLVAPEHTQGNVSWGTGKIVGDTSLTTGTVIPTPGSSGGSSGNATVSATQTTGADDTTGTTSPTTTGAGSGGQTTSTSYVTSTSGDASATGGSSTGSTGDDAGKGEKVGMSLLAIAGAAAGALLF